MSAATTTLPPFAAAQPAAAPPSAAPPVPSVWAYGFRQSIPAVRLTAAVDALVVGAMAYVTLAGAAPWPASLDAALSLSLSVADLAAGAAVALLVFATFEAAGLYEAALVRRGRDEVQRVFWATAATTAAIALGAAALQAPIAAATLEPPALLQLWAASFGAVAVARVVRARLARTVAGCRRALVVGSGPRALRLCRELSTDPLTCYHVLGFVDTSDAPRSRFIRRRTLGTLDRLEAILVREHVDEVHVGLPIKSHYPQIEETLRVCERIGVKAVYGADLFGTELARPRMGMAGASPRVELQVVTDGPAVLVKRAIDLVGAAAILVALSPLLIATAIAIKLTSDGPVIFAQERYGLNRRRFRMLKFRTMVQNAEQLQAALESKNEVQGPVFKIARDPRITPLGRWLRRTSIDELPQLVNVLRGDMSLIGPRPLPLRDVSKFERADDMRRFSVRPGLTGLWQVSGRSGLGFDQWIRFDLHYIDHWSLLLDIRILARTLPAVIRGTGAA